ncbi:MAG: MarR family transcriptional regulator [Pseudomonadota bacterium]
MQHPLLMINLMSALYWFDEALQSHLKVGGWDALTRTQSLVMANIAAGEHRLTRIARNLGVTRQATSQMLGEMERRGLIVIKPDPDDRRARIIDFSPETERLRIVSVDLLREFERQLGERIGAARFTALREALELDWGPAPQPGA